MTTPIFASIGVTMALLRAALLSLLGLVPFCAMADDVRLYMAEQPGCIYCARWNRDVAPAYPKTAEGRAAPLERYNIHHVPRGVDFARRVNFTPTFILVRNGRELGRIEGYPGEDFFWALLRQLLETHQIGPLD